MENNFVEDRKSLGATMRSSLDTLARVTADFRAFVHDGTNGPKYPTSGERAFSEALRVSERLAENKIQASLPKPDVAASIYVNVDVGGTTAFILHQLKAVQKLAPYFYKGVAKSEKLDAEYFTTTPQSAQTKKYYDLEQFDFQRAVDNSMRVDGGGRKSGPIDSHQTPFGRHIAAVHGVNAIEEALGAWEKFSAKYAEQIAADQKTPQHVGNQKIIQRAVELVGLAVVQSDIKYPLQKELTQTQLPRTEELTKLQQSSRPQRLEVVPFLKAIGFGS